jgi:hypothetical protein
MNSKPLFLALSLALMVSCSYRRDVTYHACFRDIAQMRLETAKPLRLYGAGYDLVKAGDCYDLTSVDQGKKYLIGIVPPGSSVSNQRIIEYHDIGITWKELSGDLKFKGKIYPFSHHLGTHVYPDKWKSMFELFRPADGQTWNAKPET